MYIMRESQRIVSNSLEHIGGENKVNINVNVTKIQLSFRHKPKLFYLYIYTYIKFIYKL